MRACRGEQLSFPLQLFDVRVISTNQYLLLDCRRGRAAKIVTIDNNDRVAFRFVVGFQLGQIVFEQHVCAPLRYAQRDEAHEACGPAVSPFRI